jgi:hypothetical protein
MADAIEDVRATSTGTGLTQSAALLPIPATRAMLTQYYTAHEGHSERNGHMNVGFDLVICSVYLSKESAECSKSPIHHTYFSSPKFRDPQSGHPSG